MVPRGLEVGGVEVVVQRAVVRQRKRRVVGSSTGGLDVVGEESHLARADRVRQHEGAVERTGDK